MKIVHTSNRFKKEFKQAIKRGKDEKKLKAIINWLANEEPLPIRCRPHKLTGQYEGMWECHIEPDWPLVYEVTEDEIQLFRTGTHSDLFG